MARRLSWHLPSKLVIEGLLPFLLPTLWRNTFRRITEFTDGQHPFFRALLDAGRLLILFFIRLGALAPKNLMATGSFRKNSRNPSAAARRIDRMRARLLELFRVHGRARDSPMLEYLESLLTGTARLDLAPSSWWTSSPGG